MVRYSAPFLDDGHHTTAMEWTAIPDDDEGDCIMIGSLTVSAHKPQHQRNESACGTLVPLATQRYADGPDDVIRESDPNNDSLDSAPGSNASNYEEYIDSMDRQHFLEQNYKRRRENRCVLLGTIFAVVSVILYKYAPPPPSVKITLPFTFYGKESEGANIQMDTFATTYNMQHHDWKSYCQHTLQIFTEAFIHQLSVFWYALSNSFSYAASEVRLAVVNRVSKSSGQKQFDTNHRRKHSGFTKNWCPIRIPAASNLHFALPRGVSIKEDRLLHEFSTEEFLRQSIGASLSPQNMALTLLAEGIDEWGRSLVEAAPVSLVHRMSVAVETGLLVEEQNEHNNQQWILPPTVGVLLIGPEGVGKLHTARLLGRWLFGHCDGIEQAGTGTMNYAACEFVSSEGSHDHCTNDATLSNEARNRNRDVQFHEDMLNGVLEIIAEDYASNSQEHNFDPIKEKIVNHIFQRQHLGSVVIIHHIEAVPLSLLSDVSNAITGRSDHISFTNPNGSEVSATTNGTVFVFTSKQWGTKAVFEEIQRNGMRLIGLRRESLLRSVRWEVDSHLDYWSKMANVR
jgi:hypothetical protein